jgi:hypothetical protein
MDRRDDDHLPDDLHEVEDLLHAARPSLSPLEADDIQQRVARRIESKSRPQRAGRLARLRRNGIAVALTSGLILTSGASAVLATGSSGGTWPHEPPDSAGCQYHPSWTKTYTFTKDGNTITITVSYDCKTGKFTVTITCSKPITYYYCNGKTVTVPGTTKTTTFQLDGGSQPVTVTSGGVTKTFTLPLYP